MSTLSQIFSAIAAVSLCLGVMGCESSFGSQYSANKLALSELPAPVKSTIEQQSQGGTIKEIQKETNGNKTLYAASIASNGADRKLLVGEDGKLVNKGAEDDDEDD